MRKLSFTVAALAVCAVALSAEEVAGGGASTMDVSKYRNINLLNTEGYSKQFIDKEIALLDSTYALEATDEDFERIASLDGDKYDINTAEEIALLSATRGLSISAL